MLLISSVSALVLHYLLGDLQGSTAALPVAEAIAAIEEQLIDSCKQTEQAQASLAPILLALQEVSGPGKVLSSNGKPWKGPQSKAKRAALVVDAMRDAVTAVPELVGYLCKHVVSHLSTVNVFVSSHLFFTRMKTSCSPANG